MEKEFIPYEQALALKELGFDEPCLGYYIELRNPVEGLLKIGLDNDYLQAPIYQQTFKFFREKYGLSSCIFLKMSNNKRKIWYYINELDNRLVRTMYFKSYPKGFFKTYEEAELECLKKLIKIVKDEKNNN